MQELGECECRSSPTEACDGHHPPKKQTTVTHGRMVQLEKLTLCESRVHEFRGKKSRKSRQNARDVQDAPLGGRLEIDQKWQCDRQVKDSRVNTAVVAAGVAADAAAVVAPAAHTFTPGKY